ncbi:MAG: endonuclease domain-containing protein [Candidatus Dormibacteraeota bacterium]|nr:endonuclease domain-containing protein [Candidatus Dormibacteraeota bacterium]
MSRTEWRLWYRLRSRQLLGHKFRRQVPIGPTSPTSQEGVIETIADTLGTFQLSAPHLTSPRTAGGGRLHLGTFRLLGDRTA